MNWWKLWKFAREIDIGLDETFNRGICIDREIIIDN